jgi:uncharacterized protein YprB with RNaseH-like and TPR domain
MEQIETNAESTINAVGFDIETTGVSDNDIITVACAWSPECQVSAVRWFFSLVNDVNQPR